MDETYRMLGREHEADLEREAAKWRLADQARKRREKVGSGLLQTLNPAPSRPRAHLLRAESSEHRGEVRCRI